MNFQYKKALAVLTIYAILMLFIDYSINKSIEMKLGYEYLASFVFVYCIIMLSIFRTKFFKSPLNLDKGEYNLYLHVVHSKYEKTFSYEIAQLSIVIVVTMLGLWCALGFDVLLLPVIISIFVNMVIYAVCKVIDLIL